MEKVRIALYTPLPGFANDLCDVLKLFFQVEAFDVNPEGEGGEPLRHDYQERGGVARIPRGARSRASGPRGCSVRPWRKGAPWRRPNGIWNRFST